MLTDEQLVELIKNGDKQHLQSLYEKYVDALYRFFYWQTNQRSEVAEDLTSETFLALTKSIHTFSGRSSFKNWLYAIAKNHLSAWIRERYNLPTEPLFDALPDKEDSIDPHKQRQKASQLLELLSRLSQLERKVLILRYLKNYTVAETAKALHLTASNVKVIAHRSLKKITNKGV